MNKEQMLTVIDLADWFLAKESMTHKKLQKLCYYAVAWGYTLMNKQIVENDEFQAWVHGPVSPVLYEKYKFAGWNSIQKKDVAPKFQGDIEELWNQYGILMATRMAMSLKHCLIPKSHGDGHVLVCVLRIGGMCRFLRRR